MEPDNLIAVTVVGNDRPGIVAGVTRVLFGAGCNLSDATSTILHGHFSMMLIVGAPAEVDARSLETRLASVAEELGLIITARPIEEAHAQPAAPTHMVSVYGADRPGIVFRVAERLASRGANITALSSRVIGSDEEPVYALMLEVSATGRLSDAIDELRGELGMDVTVRQIESDVL